MGEYPFSVGDELVALDAQPVHALIASFGKYFIGANQRTTDRLAAIGISSRFQEFMPHAIEVGDTAVASIRLATTWTRFDR